MIVKEYSSSAAFLKEFEAILQEREAVNQALLSFAYQQISAPVEEKSLLGAVMDEEELQLLFCRLPDHSVVLCSMNDDKSGEAAKTLADYLGSKPLLLTGVSGRSELCHSFMDQYKRYVNCIFVQKQAVDIMVIRRVNDIMLTSGMQRQAIPEEAMLATDWMLQHLIEAEIPELDYEAALQQAKRLISEGKIYLFENEESQVVSMAIAGDRLPHGVIITYVFTPKEFRGNGYAASNLYYLSKALLEEGYEYCTLSVDKKNPLSNRAYEKVGYQFLEEYYEYQVIPAENTAL